MKQDDLNPKDLNQPKFYTHAVTAEGALPASTLVGVEALVHPDLLLEVEVVAAL